MYKFYKLCLLVFLSDIKFFKSYNPPFPLKKNKSDMYYKQEPK